MKIFKPPYKYKKKLRKQQLRKPFEAKFFKLIFFENTIRNFELFYH